MRPFYFFILSITVLNLISCNDFLGIKPKGEVIPEKLSEYEVLLNHYSVMKLSDSYPVFLTDDVFLPENDMITGGTAQMLSSNKNAYTFQTEIFGESEQDQLWVQGYARIYCYNVIIENAMKATEASEEEKLSVRSEALLGRAIEYLTLINAYANHYNPSTADTDQGVPLKLDIDINKQDYVRASVKDVYSQIEKDLLESLKFLPNKPKYNSFRASKPAALGVLARMYLYMGDYEKALSHSVQTLQFNNSLVDLKNYIVVDASQWIGRINVPEGGDNPENIYMRVPQYVFGMSGDIYASEDLLNYFDKENDMRFKLYFTNSIGGFVLSYDLWAPFIFTNIAITTPEMYLIAAESEARIGNKDNALVHLNKLRSHRLQNYVASQAINSEDALKQILDERRREFTFNGCMRLIDLKRLNRETSFAKKIIHIVEGSEYILEPNSPKYILPIPSKVLRFSPDMIPNYRE